MMTSVESNTESTNTDDILIIYTGGTIGMKPNAKGYSPDTGINDLINNSLSPKALQQLQPYTILELDKPIDSANAQPNDWLTIAQYIKENYQKYSGFMVLHGTDTMAYTAAALHHLLGTNIKPVIVTGSQIPLFEARSDGASNLLEAALFLRSRHVSQVCISFAGKLIAAYAAKKTHTSSMQAFTSVNQEDLAHADIKPSFSQNFLTQQKEESLTTDKILSINFPILEQHSVSVLMLYPGITKNLIEAALLDPAIKASVLLTFGAGNPPDSNQDLINALTSARAKGVTVINMTQCTNGSVSQGSYAAGSILNTLGVISAKDRTLEDVVTDLYINLEKYQNQ